MFTRCVQCPLTRLSRPTIDTAEEKPCRNCHAANVDCLYPDNGKLLMVPEAYLRDLEADRNRRRRLPASPQSGSHREEDEDASPANSRAGGSNQHTVENSAAELFVAKVKQLRQDAPFLIASDPSLGDAGEPSDGERHSGFAASGYEYFRLNYDTSGTPKTSPGPEETTDS